jgi:hypothetical protein
MSRLAATTLLVLTSAAVAWQKPDDVSPDPPPREPISLELVGDRTVTLDRMGMTRADWIKAAKEGRLPPLPTGLKMRIQNNLKVPLRVRVTGSVPALTLVLAPTDRGEAIGPEKVKGKAGLVKGVGGVTKVTYEIIEPGKTHDIPLSGLAGFGTTGGMAVYPSEAGEWKLTAEFITALYEQTGPGAFTLHKGTLRSTLKSRPVTLTVKEK